MRPRLQTAFAGIGAFAIALALAAPARADALLTLTSSTSDVLVGDAFSLDFGITGVDDLYAFQFDVTYDSTLFSAVSVAEGTFLSQDGTLATVFIDPTIDNTLGLVSFVGDSLLGELFGVTGSGTLATIQFLASGLAGTGMLTISNIVLLDSNFLAIGTLDSISVAVNTVPEPSSLALIGVGLSALYARRRLRRRSG